MRRRAPEARRGAEASESESPPPAGRVCARGAACRPARRARVPAAAGGGAGLEEPPVIEPASRSRQGAVRALGVPPRRDSEARRGRGPRRGAAAGAHHDSEKRLRKRLGTDSENDSEAETATSGTAPQPPPAHRHVRRRQLVSVEAPQPSPAHRHALRRPSSRPVSDSNSGRSPLISARSQQNARPASLRDGAPALISPPPRSTAAIIHGPSPTQTATTLLH
jgi:hypothetical protein